MRTSPALVRCAPLGRTTLVAHRPRISIAGRTRAACHALTSDIVSTNGTTARLAGDQVEELYARYTHMDSRLDLLERQLLELIREHRTGTASLSGNAGAEPLGAEEDDDTLIAELAPGQTHTPTQAASTPQANATATASSQAAQPEAHATSAQSSNTGAVVKAPASSEGGGADMAHAAAHQNLMPRESLYGFNKLQAGVVELVNSGYIESVKQLRETLMIMEWDMNNKHLAKRRAVAAFERYVAEKDMIQEAGGYEQITSLYDDPDALEEVLHTDKMKMLARSMMEESMQDRRMLMYHLCQQQAKEMATMTAPSLPGNVLKPLGMGIAGGAKQLWTLVRGRLPF